MAVENRAIGLLVAIGRPLDTFFPLRSQTLIYVSW